MPVKNPFSEYYSTLTHAELLEILEHPANYQPLAVDAAQQEWETRALSAGQVAEIKTQLLDELSAKETQKEKRLEAQNKYKATGLKIAENISPFQVAKPTTGYLVQLITIGYAAILLFQVVTNYRTIGGYIMGMTRYPLASMLYLEPLFILLLAVVTFWKRMRVGWMLLHCFVIYTAGGVIFMLYESFKFRAYQSGLLHSFYRFPPILTIIIQLAFLGGTIYALCKPGTREIFQVNKKTMMMTIVISILLTLFILLLI